MDLATLRSKFPDYSDEELVRAVQVSQFPDRSIEDVGQALGYKPMGQFKKGLYRSFAEIPGLAAGVGGFAADAVGAEGVRDSLLGYAQKRQQQVERDYGSDAASFSNVMEGKAGAGDFLANAAGYVIGQAAQAIATGGIGAAAFKTMAKTAAKEAAVAATEKALAAGVAREAAEQAGLSAAKTVLERSVLTGATAGAGVQNLGMELGSIYPDVVEQAQKEGRQLTGEDKVRVGLSALAAAAVDTAMERITGQKMLKGTEGSTLRGRMARQVPAGMARESITEGIQTGIERYGAGKEIADAEGVREIIDSMAVGAVGGGLGGGAAALNKIQPESPAPAEPKGLDKIAGAADVDTAIKGFVEEASVPLSPAGMTAQQEARALGQLDAMSGDDMAAIRRSGMAAEARGERSSVLKVSSGQPQPQAQGSATLTDTPFGDRVLTLREQVNDPAVRDKIRTAFGEEALGTVLHYASIADRPDINMPDKTRDRVLGLAEGIVQRAVMPEVSRPTVGTSQGRPKVGMDGGPAMISLDTAQTGAIRVDSQGRAAPETRADAINTAQGLRRPDGMTQQVDKRPLPRDFTMVGDGELTTPDKPTRPGKLLLTADGFPYGTRAGAVVRAKKEGGEVVEVDGGYAVQKQETTDGPVGDVAAPAAVAAGPVDRGSNIAGGSVPTLGRNADVGSGVGGTAAEPATGAAPDRPLADEFGRSNSLNVGDSITLADKQWTVSKVTDKHVTVLDGAGSSKMFAVGSKTYGQAIGTVAKPQAQGFPAEKLTQLAEASGRTKQEVAQTYGELVTKHGKQGADRLLDEAISKAKARPKAEPTAPPATPTPAETVQSTPPEVTPEAPAERAAEAKKPEGRNADVVELRKRVSILKSLRECLAS